MLFIFLSLFLEKVSSKIAYNISVYYVIRTIYDFNIYLYKILYYWIFWHKEKYLLQIENYYSPFLLLLLYFVVIVRFINMSFPL